MYDAFAVAGEGDEGPFALDVGESAQVKLSEAEDGFDDAEGGFDGLLSFAVKRFSFQGRCCLIPIASPLQMAPVRL